MGIANLYEPEQQQEVIELVLLLANRGHGLGNLKDTDNFDSIVRNFFDSLDTETLVNVLVREFSKPDRKKTAFCLNHNYATMLSRKFSKNPTKYMKLVQELTDAMGFYVGEFGDAQAVFRHPV